MSEDFLNPAIAPRGVSRRAVVTGLAAVAGAALIASEASGILGPIDPAAAAILWNHPFTFRGRKNPPPDGDFGPRVPPVSGASSFHNGQDYSGPPFFGAEIYSVAAGRVVSSGPSGGFGNMVKIDHGTDGGARYHSVYAHMAYTPSVSVGQVVAPSTLLGFVGSTGTSGGNHLHIEIHINGNPVDPVPYIDAAPLAGTATQPTQTWKEEEDVTYYSAVGNSTDGLIKNGYTYVNSADGPLRALSNLEASAVVFERGPNAPTAMWGGDDIRNLVRIVGLRESGPEQGLVMMNGTPIMNGGRLSGTIVY